MVQISDSSGNRLEVNIRLNILPGDIVAAHALHYRNISNLRFPSLSQFSFPVKLPSELFCKGLVEFFTDKGPRMRFPLDLPIDTFTLGYF